MNGLGPGLQRLFGKQAQELFTAIAINRVTESSVEQQLSRDSLQSPVAGLVAIKSL